MSFALALQTQTEHAALALPTWVYGVIALATFLILAFVLWSFRDVSNRHALQGDAYKAAHSDVPGHGH